MNKSILKAVLTTTMAVAAVGSVTAMPLVPPYDERMGYDQYPANPTMTDEVTVHTLSADFALWSPRAEAVRVNVYRYYDDKKPLHTAEMTLDASTGTWQARVTTSQLKRQRTFYGLFYTFEVKHDGKWLAETPGIWAKALSVNGKRAAIINPDLATPQGWHYDRSPFTGCPTDAVVYEMHHRDFSISPTSGIEHKGKFLALTENGTKSPLGQATGIDHLRELGVSHVQILPSFDYNSVDETRLNEPQYNWGYDPVNYNAPDGSYSTDPYMPETRIYEMRRMIQALHNAGLGVIMDVVYNHTAVNDDSNFSLTAPGYFYRHNPDGTYSNASGCGNETASERAMMRHYIVNSVKYWATEYHIDGFRFDLMAIHDQETMREVSEALHAINPSIIIYGEGWTAGDSPLPVADRSLKDSAYRIPGVGVFSDDIRDGVKGHYSRQDDCGFATGKRGLAETVKLGIVGATLHPQVNFKLCSNAKAAYATSPIQVVNYVSCHDDLMLTDKLRASMPKATEAERQRAAKLAQTIVFTSQGIPFMWCGEEIFRDKKGVHNSYCSPDSINAIDWSLKSANRELFDYYRQLIALRKAHPAFRMIDADDIARNLVFDDTADELLISYSLHNHANGDSFDEIKLIFNGSDDDKEVEVPTGNWTILATDGHINAGGLGATRGGKLRVAHRSATILAR